MADNVRSKLDEILRKARTNNINLGKVLDIINQTTTDQKGTVDNLTQQIQTMNTESEKQKTEFEIINRESQAKIDSLNTDIATKVETINNLIKEKKALDETLTLQNNNNAELRDQRSASDDEVKRLTSEIEQHKSEINRLNELIKKNSETSDNEVIILQGKLKDLNDELNIEKGKYDQLIVIVTDIEEELNKTNVQLQNTKSAPLNLAVELNEYGGVPAAITGGKSLKMKKHHKKHLKRKTRKIRNKKHKSK